jgi:hypothetical protein
VPSSSGRRGRRALAALLLLLPGVWLASRVPALPAGTRLELVDAETDRLLLARTLREGEAARLTWTNSLFGLAVTERFEARGGILLQTGVAFADPRGGEPPRVRPEDVDDLYHTGGAFRAEGLARPLRQAVFRVGAIGHPTLQIGEQSLPFLAAVGFGGAVRLSARPAGPLERLALLLALP